MPRMHAHELEIDEPLVRRLLAERFPEWADRPLRRIEPAGTVNAIFRLGDDLSVRLPRLDGRTEPGGKELEWLPRLAGSVPLAIPVPVAQGAPTSEYPWYWDVYRWVDGDTVPVEAIDPIRAARDLAAFVAALQRVDPAGAPQGRGIPLAVRDEEIRYWLARFEADLGVTASWERALVAPPWDGPPVWHHGDLDVRNWLVRDGRVSGVIDWGSMGVGDPACDVMVAWKLHSSAARDAFREAFPTDEATLGTGPRLGPVAGRLGAGVLHAGEQPHPVPRSGELARARPDRRGLAPTRHAGGGRIAGVARGRIELPTPRFSAACSTN
jgi:aminoglycoside phosphotransferase (APT) family kinase protein